MLDLLAIGDTKLDIFMDLGDEARVACKKSTRECELHIQYGQKIPARSATLLPAGSAMNVAIGVRRLGKQTGLETTMGDDPTSLLTQTLLKKERIDNSRIRIKKAAQSSVSTILNFEGESTIVSAHTHLPYSKDPHTDVGCVFVGELGTEANRLYPHLMRQRRKNQFLLAVNPGRAELKERADTLLNLLAEADILFLNRSEAERLTESRPKSIPRLFASLTSLAPNALLVVTDGQHGAYASVDGHTWHAPMFPGKRIEATGAGDAFASGFLAALLFGHPVQTALAWGSVNSASVVGHIGGQDGLLSKRTLQSRLASTSYSVTSL